MRFAGNLLAVGVAVFAARVPRRRYRAHAYHGGANGKLLGPWLLAFLANIAAIFLVAFVTIGVSRWLRG